MENRNDGERNKMLKEYDIFYSQMFNRMRMPYWDLMQINSMNSMNALQYNPMLSQMLIPPPHAQSQSLPTIPTLQSLQPIPTIPSTQPLSQIPIPDYSINPSLYINYYSQINNQQTYPFFLPFTNLRNSLIYPI